MLSNVRCAAHNTHNSPFAKSIRLLLCQFLCCCTHLYWTPFNSPRATLAVSRLYVSCKRIRAIAAPFKSSSDGNFIKFLCMVTFFKYSACMCAKQINTKTQNTINELKSCDTTNYCETVKFRSISSLYNFDDRIEQKLLLDSTSATGPGASANWGQFSMLSIICIKIVIITKEFE